MPGLSCLGAAHGSCSNQHVARGPCGRACNIGTSPITCPPPAAMRPLARSRWEGCRKESRVHNFQQMILFFCAKTELKEG